MVSSAIVSFPTAFRRLCGFSFVRGDLHRYFRQNLICGRAKEKLYPSLWLTGNANLRVKLSRCHSCRYHPSYGTYVSVKISGKFTRRTGDVCPSVHYSHISTLHNENESREFGYEDGSTEDNSNARRQGSEDDLPAHHQKREHLAKMGKCVCRSIEHTANG